MYLESLTEIIIYTKIFRLEKDSNLRKYINAYSIKISNYTNCGLILKTYYV